jgi:hypothetical protein
LIEVPDISSYGASYFGDFVGEKMEGEGTMKWGIGNKYEEDCYTGEWKNNKIEGKGKYIWKNVNIYEGDFKEGKRTGKGKRTFENGDIYSGDFVDNKFEGKGIYMWSASRSNTKRKYEGDWKEGNMEGKGKETFNNGDTYSGDFVGNLREGNGIYIYSCSGPNAGRKYEGDWKEGKSSGKGKEIFPNGDTYSGDFVDDEFEGKGKYIWLQNEGEKSEIYKGQFEKGMKHGVGLHAFNNGVIIKCEYIKDERRRILFKCEKRSLISYDKF